MTPTQPPNRSGGPAGIGELNERSLHRALKARYAVEGSAIEQSVDGFVADVVVDGRIIEIHTGSFSPLRRKLPRLLRRHQVTLVHPIARDRYIVKLPAGPDAEPTRRMSPKHGTLFHVFSGLVSIPGLLAHPNLTLEIVMTVEEDLRRTRPGRRWGRSWTRLDTRLLEVLETHAVSSMADLFAPVDAELPDRFGTADIARAMKVPRRLGQQAAFCLREGGVCEVCGKSGNALVYRRAVTA